MQPPTLLFEQSAAILTITLNQPARLNPLDLAQWRELGAALVRARDDTAIRAVVLTGAGRAFSAGADLRGMRERRDAAAQRARLAEIHPIILELAQLPKPTIAALNGVAAGIGASLALACDLIVADEGANLICSWAKIGLAPDGGASWRLVREIGPRRAKELLMSCRPLPAAEAYAWGLVNRVAPAGQTLAQAQALAQTLIDFSPHALRQAKMLIDQAATDSLVQHLEAEAAAQAECVETAEFRAAVAAFLDRPPRA